MAIKLKRLPQHTLPLWSLWAIVLTPYAIFPDSFGRINSRVLEHAFIYLLTFTISYNLIASRQVIRALKPLFHVTENRPLSSSLLLQRLELKRLAIPLAFTLLIISSIIIISVTLTMGFGEAARNFFFLELRQRGPLYLALRLLGASVFIFLVASLLTSSRKKAFIYFSMSILSAALTFGRTYILMTLIVHYVRSLLVNGFKLRRTLLYLSLVVLTSSPFVIIFNKGSEDSFFLSSTLKSIIDYSVAPVGALSRLYDIKFSHECGVLLPEKAAAILQSLLDLKPFVESQYCDPLPYEGYAKISNVYTILFRAYSDYGILGLVAHACIFGLTLGCIYSLAKSGSSRALLVYLFSWYPCLMSIFDDVFITSPTLWIPLAVICTFLVSEKPKLVQ